MRLPFHDGVEDTVLVKKAGIHDQYQLYTFNSDGDANEVFTSGVAKDPDFRWADIYDKIFDGQKAVIKKTWDTGQTLKMAYINLIGEDVNGNQHDFTEAIRDAVVYQKSKKNRRIIREALIKRTKNLGQSI